MANILVISIIFAIVVLGCLAIFLLVHPEVLGMYNKQVGKTVKIGWIGTESENSMNFSFRVFDGKKYRVIWIQSNSTLKIFYSVALSRGEITIEVLDPDGISFFSKSIRNCEDNTITLE